MLNFAALTPHAPIIIPEVGGGESKKVKKTQEAFEVLAEKLGEIEPDTIIVISPHGLIYPDRPNIVISPNLVGDFSNFGAPDIKFEFKNDLGSIEKLDHICQKENFPVAYTNNEKDFWQLDHGTLVPLYFLLQELAITPKIIPITYSLELAASQALFGQFLFDIINNSKKRFAIIASGDLSHRLITDPIGRKFDESLVKSLRENKPDEIMTIDPDFTDRAGECGWRSLIILLGAISSLKYTPKVLSYEGPFGVGYAVVDFELK